MKVCGVKKIYKTPEVAIFAAYGNSVLTASDPLNGYDAEGADISWSNWLGGNL